MSEPAAPLLLVLPLVRPGGGQLDAWLGDSLARTLCRRLEATGRRVVPMSVVGPLCKSMGIDLPDGPLPPSDLELLLAQTGASHVVHGHFDRGGELSLTLRVLLPAGGREVVSARGPESDFQEAIDDALVRLIQHVPGAKGQHVRVALRQARTTESLDAYLAVVRARAAWARGDVQAFEDEVAAAVRLDPAYVDPHDVVANAARAMGDTARAVTALREMARLHGEAGRRRDQASVLLSVGAALVKGGEWSEGIEAYEHAADLFDALGEEEVRGWVQARMNLANVLLRRGEHARAIEEYQHGLERVRAFPEDYAKLVFNLGLALKETGDLDAAVTRLEEARALGFELRDHELIASAYNALGAVMDDQGDLDRALTQFRRAEEHLDSQADPVLLAGVKDHIGIIFKKRGEMEKALEYSEQACQLFETRGYPLHLANAYVNRAGLLLELERDDEAAPFAVAAHREFVRLGSPSRSMTERMLRDALGFDEEMLEDIEAEGRAAREEDHASGDLVEDALEEVDEDDEGDEGDEGDEDDEDDEDDEGDLDDESLDDLEEDLEALEEDDEDRGW